MTATLAERPEPLTARTAKAAAPRFEITGVAHGPVVAVLGGISASRHVTSSPENPHAGWWEQVVGAGKAIDTDTYRVLGMDYLPQDDDPLDVSTEDQAHALAAALDGADIDKLRAVVGASYGGMVALAFGALYPERASQLVVISAAHESDPLTTASRVLQRRVVELGLATGHSTEALATARGIAMTSYATADEFRRKFDSGGR